MYSAHQEKLFIELKTALARTRTEDIKDWGKRSTLQLPRITTRRISNLGKLLGGLASFTGRELRDAVRAMSQGRFGTHFGERAAAAIDGTIEIGNRVKSAVSAISGALYSDPQKNVPGVLALALGFLVGSGGVDGNGGLPDSDLLLGIEWHRSPFTHSIIMGVVVEGAILALVDLTGVIHDKLPPGYDPFWDKLLDAKESIAVQLSQGASAGIAYHLGVDATLQPGAYHDMPFEMPMEAHQTILAMNAAAEGVDVLHKQDQTAPSKGTQIVNAAGAFTRTTGACIRGFFDGLRGSA